MRARRRGINNISRNRKIAGSLLAAAVAAGTAYAVPSSADASPNGTQAGARAPLSPRLTALVSGDKSGTDATGPLLSIPQTGAGSLLRTPDGKRVVVDLRLSSRDDATIQSIEAAGARLLPQPADYGRLAVSVLPQDLTAVADVPGVLYVGEEITPQLNACDTTISEGDGILHADDLRATGVDGTGVKVGVMSDSYNKAAAPFTNAPADILSDNLPGATNTCGHTTVSTVADKPTAGTDEGRGMMQIVHDLAPGSPLDFATAFISEPSFASNITALANQGAKVIVDDVTYFDEPMYQDGVVEKAVTGVRAMGVDYFSSSANNRYVKNGHEVGSYEAVDGYRPTACPAGIPAGHVDCHNFGAGVADSTFSYTPANTQVIRPLLAWAQPWDGGITTDLDLYLIDDTGHTVLLSAATNNIASQQSFEFFAATQNTSVGNWALVVARKTATATPRFKLVFAGNGNQPFGTLEHETPVAGTTDVMGPTTFGHNGGADVMSVGASDVRVATALNSYSSYGPVTILFGPVNGVTPAAPLPTPLVLAKPDLVASDCNVTTFFAGAGPPFHFCGTSAAAPHAAAVAALLRQKFPTASAEQVNAAMISSAVDIAGVPGSFQGGGLVDAFEASTALAATPPPAAPTVTGTDPTSPGASTTPKVKGTSSAGSTVYVYATSDCSGSPVGSGTAAQFTSPGIQVTVAAGTTTTFRAQAFDGIHSSGCSGTSATYTQQSVNPPPAAPDTTITKAPKKTVKTTKRKAKVSFTFTSTITGSTFACSIDGKAFTACTSGVTYKLKAGKHTFAVRATAAGVTDPTPATYAFKVKRKKHH